MTPCESHEESARGGGQVVTVVAEFIVDGEPVPKARARVVNGHTYTPHRTRDAESAVLQAWMRVGISHRPRKEDRYKVRLTFWRGTRRACDIDNLAKTVLDALNGHAWLDDSQIVGMTLYKNAADAEGPRTAIRIELLDEQEAAA